MITEAKLKEVWEIISKKIGSNVVQELSRDLSVSMSLIASIENGTLLTRPEKFQYTVLRLIECELWSDFGIEYMPSFIYTEVVLFPERVRFYMQKNNITKCNICHITRISKNRFDDILTSKKEATIFEKYAIADVVGVSLNDLLVDIRYDNNENESFKYALVAACYIRDISVEAFMNKVALPISLLEDFFKSNDYTLLRMDRFKNMVSKQLGIKYVCSN